MQMQMQIPDANSAVRLRVIGRCTVQLVRYPFVEMRGPMRWFIPPHNFVSASDRLDPRKVPVNQSLLFDNSSGVTARGGVRVPNPVAWALPSLPLRTDPPTYF